MKIVFRVDWLESEFGFGTRPDGYSLHLTEEDSKAFIEEYWATMPEKVPDEYSRPNCPAYKFEVNDKVYNKIKQSKNGVRIY